MRTFDSSIIAIRYSGHSGEVQVSLTLPRYRVVPKGPRFVIFRDSKVMDIVNSPQEIDPRIRLDLLEWLNIKEHS